MGMVSMHEDNEEVLSNQLDEQKNRLPSLPTPQGHRSFNSKLPDPEGMAKAFPKDEDVELVRIVGHYSVSWEWRPVRR
jgi:hypothetical protein